MSRRFVINFTAGPFAGRSFSLGPGEELTIGKDSECKVAISDDTVLSRRHARVFFARGKIYFEDLKSTNGSFVTGKRIAGKIQLFPGVVVTLGTATVFQGSWWNALEPSRFASMAVLTQVTDVLAKARALEGGKAFLRPGFWRRFFLVLTILIVALVLVAAVVRPAFLSRFDPLEEISIQEIIRKNTRADSRERESATVPRNFVWDEIVNVSRRFGDPPPSAMDPEFLKKVERWIERFTKDDAHLRVLKRKEGYWPQIEQAFVAEGLPVDLGYVAWVESGFDPAAKSGMGALGMWQFMPASARAFNLVVTPQTDERLDAVKSSVAAARYFTLLLKMFGSERYLLAVASYNAGQNKIKRKAIAAAIRSAKHPDFWHLRGDLPPETVDYVPKVLAAIIVSRNPERW
jgi:hypothetical protein